MRYKPGKEHPWAYKTQMVVRNNEAKKRKDIRKGSPRPSGKGI